MQFWSHRSCVLFHTMRPRKPQIGNGNLYFRVLKQSLLRVHFFSVSCCYKLLPGNRNRVPMVITNWRSSYVNSTKKQRWTNTSRRYWLSTASGKLTIPDGHKTFPCYFSSEKWWNTLTAPERSRRFQNYCEVSLYSLKGDAQVSVKRSRAPLVQLLLPWVLSVSMFS